MKKVLLLLALFIGTFGYTQEAQTTKQTLENMIKPYVADFLDATKKGAEFVVDETPLVIKEYIVFESVSRAIVLFIGIYLMLLMKPILTRVLLVKSEKSPESDDDSHWVKWVEKKPSRWLKTDSDGDWAFEQFVYTVLPPISAIVGVIIFLSNIFAFVKVTFFPKLFLVEKFFELI